MSAFGDDDELAVGEVCGRERGAGDVQRVVVVSPDGDSVLIDGQRRR